MCGFAELSWARFMGEARYEIPLIALVGSWWWGAEEGLSESTARHGLSSVHARPVLPRGGDAPLWGFVRGYKSICVADGCDCRRDGLSIPCRSEQATKLFGP